jgi:hypothetical protein
MTDYHINLIPFKNVDLNIDLKAGLQMKGSNIEVEFLLTGDVSSIEMPSREENGRRVIGLWESTCFEFFVLNNETLSYYEFNFSPEGHWNAFYFPKKKAPLKEAENFLELVSNQKLTDNTYKLTVSIDLYRFHPGFWQEGKMSFGLTSVIESNKKISYWAINHLDDKPNFHNFETFKKIEL